MPKLCTICAMEEAIYCLPQVMAEEIRMKKYRILTKTTPLCLKITKGKCKALKALRDEDSIVVL